MNDLSKWSPFRVSTTLEFGSAKLTIDTGQLNGGLISPTFSVKSGKYYIAITDIKNGTAVGGGRFYIENLSANKFENVVYSSDGFKSAWAAYAPTADVTNCNLVLVVDGASGQYAYYDSVRIYEISADDYTALDSMTPEQIAAKYPYVDSVQPVRNPYAIRYGENLLPPFYEWNAFSINNPDMNGPYDVTFTAPNAENTFYYTDIQLEANTTYSFSAEHNGYISLNGLYNGIQYIPNTAEQFATFKTTEAAIVRVYVSNILAAPKAGTFSFKNPMLTVSFTPKPFKPREDSMLALQTDLFADPVTGANADEVFEKDGHYFKVAKWKKVLLDGTQNYVSDRVGTGYKTIKLADDPLSLAAHVFPEAVKYDGSILKKWQTVIDSGDFLWFTTTNKNIYLTISNEDSGWGDTYTPTADEIKAYFMGWKMYDASTNSDGTGVFNGSGLKSWVRISSWSWAGNMYTDGGYGSVPRSQAKDYTPYQLIYQLAVPTVEPIVSEGMLTFNEGDNQLEVGTGIVLRESAKPYQDGNGWWNLGNPVAISGVSRSFKYKARDILNVYQNGLEDPRWIDVPTDKYGSIAQLYPMYSADQSSTYSVTYLMMDLSPIVPFTGTYAAKEKAMLQELTEVVQQNATAVSVLMNKKADKDTPAWITPTLLNGWGGFNQNGYTTARFFKDSMGYVHIDGLIKGGSVVAGTTVFVLPVGYRPSQVLSSASMSASTDEVTTSLTRIRVGTDGQVQLSSGALSGFVVLNIPPFLAEQ